MSVYSTGVSTLPVTYIQISPTCDQQLLTFKVIVHTRVGWVFLPLFHATIKALEIFWF